MARRSKIREKIKLTNSENAGSPRVFNNLHKVFHTAMKNVEVDINNVKSNFFALFDKIRLAPLHL
jgi:hypothetical protein